MINSKNALSKERVRELFDYDRSTGLLAWLKSRRGRFGNVGDEAGSIDKTGHIRVGIDGKIYSAARVIHLWVTGVLPHRMLYKDGDPQNLKWVNLADASEGYSMKKSARTAREYRAVRDEAVEIIKSDPDLSRAYQRGSPEDARAIMRTVTKNVRLRRAQKLSNREHGQDDN